MTIVENADLKLSVTIYSDEEDDLAIMLQDIARQVERGSLAGVGGGCIGSYSFSVDMPSRDAQQRNEADLPQHIGPEKVYSAERIAECISNAIANGYTELGVTDIGDLLIECCIANCDDE